MLGVHSGRRPGTAAAPARPNLQPPTSNHHQPQAKLLEHNVRFGDPECQSLMMRMDSDMGEALTMVRRLLPGVPGGG